MSILPKRRVKDPSKPKERERTIRNAQVIGSLLALAGSTIVGPSAFAGHSIRSLLRSAKLAPGRVGNIKLPDTIGNRIKQAESLLKFKTGRTVNYDKTAIPRDVVSTSHWMIPSSVKRAPNPFVPSTFVGSYIGTFQQKKTGRILEKAVAQGPTKFFSKFDKGRTNVKTGVTAGKRKKRYGTASHNREEGWQPNFGAQGGTSKGSLLRYKKKVKPYNPF